MTTSTTSFTVEQVAALEKAIASGVLTASYEGKSVTYRSMDDLKEALFIAKRSVYGTQKRKFYVRTRGDKGL